MSILKQDPRPAYQDSSDRIYGFGFSGFELKFRVKDGVLTVCKLEKSGEID